METLTINIGLLESVIAITGFLLTLGITWSSLNTNVKILSKNVSEINVDVKNLQERFFILEGKASGTFMSQSPISLTDKGNMVLKESGIKKYIEYKGDSFPEIVCKSSELSPYDIQKQVFEYFDEMEIEEPYQKIIKDYAFNHGVSTDVVRRVGAIYFRDICLSHFNIDVKNTATKK